MQLCLSAVDATHYARHPGSEHEDVFVDCAQASVRCLAPFGSLLEIGKFDMVVGTMLPMRAMLRGVNYQSIFLEEILDEGPSGNPAKVRYQ